MGKSIIAKSQEEMMDFSLLSNSAQLSVRFNNHTTIFCITRNTCASQFLAAKRAKYYLLKRKLLSNQALLCPPTK